MDVRSGQMRLRLRWLQAGQALLLVLGMVALGSAGALGHGGAADGPVDAIGRLIVNDTGVCTAFVVRSVQRLASDEFGKVITLYENWLVSAGHCVGQNLRFLQGGVAHSLAGILGFSTGGRRGHDVMVAAFMTDRPMPILEPAFGEYPKVGDKVMLIGYGRNALMMRVGPVVGYDERGHMMIVNFASPGNSGGPVLIPGTRRVVGVGIETTLRVRPGLPVMLCRFVGCGVQPPYYAAHIDRLLGVATFRPPEDAP